MEILGNIFSTHQFCSSLKKKSECSVIFKSCNEAFLTGEIQIIFNFSEQI